MKNYDLDTRYHHIKLHSKCLLKINIDLLDQKISLSTYCKKSRFFVRGIIRSLLLNCHFLDEPKNQIQHDKKENQHYE